MTNSLIEGVEILYKAWTHGKIQMVHTNTEFKKSRMSGISQLEFEEYRHGMR